MGEHSPHLLSLALVGFTRRSVSQERSTPRECPNRGVESRVANGRAFSCDVVTHPLAKKWPARISRNSLPLDVP